MRCYVKSDPLLTLLADRYAIEVFKRMEIPKDWTHAIDGRMIDGGVEPDEIVLMGKENLRRLLELRERLDETSDSVEKAQIRQELVQRGYLPVSAYKSKSQ